MRRLVQAGIISHVNDEVDGLVLIGAAVAMHKSPRWRLVPKENGSRGEVRYYSLDFNDEAIRFCNEASGGINCD